MIESQLKVLVPGIEDARAPGVVGGLGRAPRPGDEHRRNGVKARVSRRVGVGVKLAEELDVERRFLSGLPEGGRLERLTVVDKAAGQSPAGWRIFSLDKDYPAHFSAIHQLDDDIDCRDGISESLTAHLATRPDKAILRATPKPCQSP